MRRFDPTGPRTLVERGSVRYGLAVASVALAFVVRLLAEPVTGTGAPFVLFFAAVLVTNILAGAGPGLLATLLSVPLACREFIVRAGFHPSQVISQATLFLIDCSFIAYLAYDSRRARQFSEEAEERLRLANRAARIVSWDVDFPALLVRWSPDSLQQLESKVPMPARLGSLLHVVHPDDRPGLERALEASRDPTGNGELRAEVRVLRKNGGVRWYACFGHTYFAEHSGKRVAVRQVGTAIDVTERLQTEEALRALTEKAKVAVAEREEMLAREQAANATLRQSEERFRLTFDEAPIGMALVDMDGRLLRVNQVLCEILGYSAQELRRVGFQDVTYPPDLGADVTLFRQLARGEIPRYQMEKRYIRRDGSLVYAALSVSLLRDADGNPLCNIAQVEEIQARKEAEAALRTSESRQQLLARASALLVTTLDYAKTLEAVAQLVVLELADWCIAKIAMPGSSELTWTVACRDPARAQTARELERLRINRRWPSFVRAGERAPHAVRIEHVQDADLQAIAQSPEHLSLLRAMDPTSMMDVPLVIRGQVLGGLVFVASDSSPAFTRDDLELAQALADRATLAVENGRLYEASVQAAQLRDQVLAVVAHDLRNPLAVILSQAGGIAKKEVADSAWCNRTSGLIQRAASRMNRLIQDLLDVAVIEAGQLSIEREPLEPRELLQESIDSQHTLARDASLTLELDIDGAVPMIRGDPNRLLQVLENLIGNAVKFSNPGGHIRVGAVAREGAVLFWVADTGRGIPPEAIPHVFDRFWQVRKGTRQGAGLGLPISRGIVEAHGGRLWVESEVERGATFFFTIPRLEPGERPLLPGSSSAERESTIH